MALRINFNYESAVTHTSLLKNEREMNKSLLRLSTGMRILNASDDAAGMFIADQLSIVATGYREGNRNIQTGLSALRIAENAAGQIFDRLKEIYARATRAANDINDPNARASLQAEITNFIDAIQRIGTDTEYNGIKLLDGTFINKAIHYGQRNDQILSIDIRDIRAIALGTNLLNSTGNVSSNTGNLTAANFPDYVYTGPQTATINGRSVTITAGSNNLIDAATFARSINNDPALKEQGFRAYAKNTSKAAEFTSLFTVAGNATLDSATLKFYVGEQTFDITNVGTTTTLDELITKINTQASDKNAQVRASKEGNRLVLNTTNGETIAVEVTMNITGTGTVTVNLNQLIEGATPQSRTNSGAVSAVKTGRMIITAPEKFNLQFQQASNAAGLGFQGQNLTAQFTNLYGIDVRTNEGSELAMVISDAAIRTVDRVRANIGAIMNNLQSIYDAQKVALDNTQEAENVIRNTDYAEEMSNFIKMQIRMQSGIAMLAQANALPQLVLQLLR